MIRITMLEDLVNLNKNGNFEQSIDVLKEFLIDESIEAFLKEERAFGIERDFIKSNKHFVDKLDKAKIEVYSNEHPPAHFHFNIAEFKGSYDIKNCEIIEGNIPRKYEKKLILWYKNGGKEKIIQKWNSTRPENCSVGEF